MIVRMLVEEGSLQDILIQRNAALAQDEQGGECTVVARSPSILRLLDLRSHSRIVCRQYRFLYAAISGFV